MQLFADTIRLEKKKLKKVLLLQWAVILIAAVGVTLFANSAVSESEVLDTFAIVPTSLPNPNGTISIEEVSRHSSISDCWQVIYYKVYNTTNYPGPDPLNVQTPIGDCGGDATQEFVQVFRALPQGRGDLAFLELLDYYVGDLQTSNLEGGECGHLDSNGDGKLDLVDFMEFSGVYQKTCTDSPVTQNCGKKDTNDNSKIDIADFTIFSSKYRQPSCT